MQGQAEQTGGREESQGRGRSINSLPLKKNTEPVLHGGTLHSLSASVGTAGGRGGGGASGTHTTQMPAMVKTGRLMGRIIHRDMAATWSGTTSSITHLHGLRGQKPRLS